MIVVETTQGLLVAAMLERMGGKSLCSADMFTNLVASGFGKLVQVFFGDFPVK